MAIYGKDFYGLAKYGSEPNVEFDATPFVARPEGYGKINVSWSRPAGTWDRFRLLRSRAGFAVNPNDGEVILDEPEESVPLDYLDEGLLGTTWYYYTILVRTTGGKWVRAGVTSGLSLKDTGMTGLMWEKIPRYFRYARRFRVPVNTEVTTTTDSGLEEGIAGPVDDDLYWTADDFNYANILDLERTSERLVENQQLHDFVGVLGWGFEYLTNYAQTLLWANDARHTHLENLERLGEQLGVEYSYDVPAAASRALVENAALLYRRKGTIDGLRDLATMATGWGIDLEVSPNMMLNEANASFVFPRYRDWDPATRYEPLYPYRDRVQYAGRVFKCIAAAQGLAQRPLNPWEGDSNTWWQLTVDNPNEDDDGNSFMRDTETNAIGTWKGWVGDTPHTAYMAVGVSSPFDADFVASNALRIKNTTGSAATLELWGAANGLSATSHIPGQKYVIGQGVPIPRAFNWDPAREYVIGEVTVDRGSLWRAIKTHTNRKPNANGLFWEKVGIDTRQKWGYSFWTHGSMTGAAGTGRANVYPGVAFFGDRGGLLAEFHKADWDLGIFYDTFNTVQPWEDREPEYTLVPDDQWVVHQGSWNVWDVRNEDRVAYATGYTGTPSRAVTTVQVPVSIVDYKVAVTFGDKPTPARNDYLVLRWVDANNFLRVGRTSVEKWVSGSLATSWPLATPIVAGNRVVVHVHDSTNSWELFVNGVQVLAATSSGFPTGVGPFRHGLMVE